MNFSSIKSWEKIKADMRKKDYIPSDEYTVYSF